MEYIIYPIIKIDERYPNIKREYPKAKYMDIQGNKFSSVGDAIYFRKKQRDYKNRVKKPEIKIEII